MMFFFFYWIYDASITQMHFMSIFAKYADHAAHKTLPTIFIVTNFACSDWEVKLIGQIYVVQLHQ